MMEQKMKEEEERKRTKEIEERMSLEETKEQVGKVMKTQNAQKFEVSAAVFTSIFGTSNMWQNI